MTRLKSVARLTDDYLIVAADELLTQLSVDVHGHPDGQTFTREELVPQLVSYARAEISGEFEHFVDVLESSRDRRPGAEPLPLAAWQERKRIIALMRILIGALQSTEPLT